MFPLVDDLSLFELDFSKIVRKLSLLFLLLPLQRSLHLLVIVLCLFLNLLEFLESEVVL